MTHAPLPFVLVGDAPGQTSGLSRILTDLARHLWAERDTLGIDLRVVGYAPFEGLPKTGVPGASSHWQSWIFSDVSSWGRQAVQTAYRSWFGNRPGIVMTIWDPSRCFALTGMGLPGEQWGYFPVDAENVNGGISGPAAEAVQRYDRVLAYSQFGARILSSVTSLPVPHLPHGIDGTVFHPVLTEREYLDARATLGIVATEKQVVGCVATNQPRKDLGLYCQALRALLDWGHDVHGWLHIDREIGEAWSIPQLASDLGLNAHLTVTLNRTDRELAALYSLSSVTLAPGRGEGFGYPIVESQACGCPAVHGNYGGGAEFTPDVVDPRLFQLVGPYALRRPILDVRETAVKLAALLSTDPSYRRTVQQGVQHLAWSQLWPAWRQWFDDGLTNYRVSRAARD